MEFPNVSSGWTDDAEKALAASDQRSKSRTRAKRLYHRKRVRDGRNVMWRLWRSSTTDCCPYTRRKMPIRQLKVWSLTQKALSIARTCNWHR
uniref:Uncharacterized protein n=1 Tax=Hyaloperonospora arabidopsidis (strain Emoy2) TaxID=559515 RepID=M4BPM6_HYAAE